MKKLLLGLAGLMVLSGCGYKFVKLADFHNLDQVAIAGCNMQCDTSALGYDKCDQVRSAACDLHSVLKKWGVK